VAVGSIMGGPLRVLTRSYPSKPACRFRRPPQACPASGRGGGRRRSPQWPLRPACPLERPAPCLTGAGPGAGPRHACPRPRPPSLQQVGVAGGTAALPRAWTRGHRATPPRGAWPTRLSAVRLPAGAGREGRRGDSDGAAQGFHHARGDVAGAYCRSRECARVGACSPAPGGRGGQGYARTDPSHCIHGSSRG